MTRYILAAALLGLSTGAIAQTTPAPVPAGTGVSFDQYAAKARERMMVLDTNHDGRISKDEFAARADMMRGMRHGDTDQAADANAPKRHDPSRMFTRLDTNTDGYLDVSEMNVMVAKRFARMDANHDGVLTPDERHARHGMNAPEQ